MKKIILVLSMICTLLVCGCTKQEEKYTNFEHFNLNEKNMQINTFYYYREEQTYAIADITSERKSEVGINGLFYQVGKNDYILLDEIEVCSSQPDLPTNKKYTFFYKDKEKNENKLFINRCLGGLLLEYILNGDKFERKELKFDIPKISDNPLEYVMIEYIEKVEPNYIYYNARIRNTNNENITIKCSLNTYICELSENQN